MEQSAKRAWLAQGRGSPAFQSPWVCPRSRLPGQGDSVSLLPRSHCPATAQVALLLVVCVLRLASAASLTRPGCCRVPS